MNSCLTFTGGKCLTTDFYPCSFPFDYHGKKYFHCINKARSELAYGSYWCGTDEVSKAIGECDENCPLSKLDLKFFLVKFIISDNTLLSYIVVKNCNFYGTIELKNDTCICKPGYSGSLCEKCIYHINYLNGTTGIVNNFTGKGVRCSCKCN